MMRLRDASLLLVLLFSGCAVVGYPSGRPPSPPEAEAAPGGDLGLPPGVPMIEALSRYGNPDSYEQFGETYEVLESAVGYDEEGVASWYGEEFAGRRTSSGEPYDPELLTAAHRTLPLPTWARVTNLENGRSVIVRINDRGPFVDPDDRIIDVSRAAARKLDLIAPGTARVRVEALTSPVRAGG